MKNINLLRVLFLSASLFLMSCSDFLERQSQDEVIVKTAADFSELLLGSGYVTVVQYQAAYFMDDDIAIYESPYYSELFSVYQGFGAFSWQPDMWEREYVLPDSYTDTYKRIMGVNAVLDGIESASGSKEDKDQVRAEALALRGYYYWMLVNLYAEPYNMNKDALGVPIKLTANLEENGMSRNTVEEVYDRIVKDLTLSAQIFEKYTKRRANYRINSTSVYILLSRAYLFMEQWDDAITAATKAIETSEGLTDYTKLVVPVFMPDYSHSEVEWVYGVSFGLEFLGPSEDLLSKYDTGDCRPDIWFNFGEYATNHLSKKDYDWMSGSVTPVNTIRISEAYLNRAEAYVMRNKKGQALIDLNDLKRKRIVGYADATEANIGDILEEVRLERRRELCFDEMRWFDLRRYGMPSIKHKYRYKTSEPWVEFTLKEKDPMYTLPFPNAVVKENPSLVQNPSAYEIGRSGVEVTE